MFSTESEMSLHFERYFKRSFGNAYIKECKGLFGVPDFVCYDKTGDGISIISFELKLKNWRRASTQAYRYKSFSDMAYVILPHNQIKTALKNIDHFKKYNIGLALFQKRKGLNIIYKPNISKPYSENLNLKIKKSVQKSRKKVKNLDFF